MRVFLDTNVLVAAFATRGLCADVLRAVLAEHELVTAQVVLRELARVLTKKLRVPKASVDEILDLLRQQELGPTGTEIPQLKLKDQDDLLVIASALAAKTEVFITGDQELLKLKAGKLGLRILSPRDFWDLLVAQTD